VRDKNFVSVTEGGRCSASPQEGEKKNSAAAPGYGKGRGVVFCAEGEPFERHVLILLEKREVKKDVMRTFGKEKRRKNMVRWRVSSSLLGSD